MDRLIGKAIFGCVYLPGIIGNAVIIIVKWKRSQQSVTNYLLKVLAVWDFLYLSCAMIEVCVTEYGVPLRDQMEYWLEFLFEKEGMRSSDCFSDWFTVNSTELTMDRLALQEELCHWFFKSLFHDYITTVTYEIFCLSKTFQMCSVFQTVVIGIFRCIAVCRPFLAPRICKMKFARMITVFPATLSILIHLPYYVLASKSLIQSITIDFITAYHKIFYNLCMFFILPFSILLILNGAIMVELWRDRGQTRNQQDSTQKARHQENMAVTRVIIVVILVFLVSYITKPLYAMSTNIFNILGNPVVELAQLAIFFMPAFNSVVNFYIYFTMHKTFRKELFSLWRKQ